MCTPAENVVATDCLIPVSDAGVCPGPGAPDGGTPCAQCLFTPAGASAWGAFLDLRPLTAVGATTTTILDLYNFGGCVALVDPSPAGKACGTALDELTQCELASCLPSCPITSTQDVAGTDALVGSTTSVGCLGNADNTVCVTYANAANTACANATNDAGTGAIDRCNAILTAANAATVSAPAGLEQYLGLFCGGADAGL